MSTLLFCCYLYLRLYLPISLVASFRPPISQHPCVVYHLYMWMRIQSQAAFLHLSFYSPFFLIHLLPIHFHHHTLFTANINVYNIVRLISVKLDHNNLSWKSHFLAILQTYELGGNIDGSLQCPPPFLKYDGISTLNPEQLFGSNKVSTWQVG